MTAEQVWDELLQITEQSVSKRIQLGGPESDIRWLRPNRLVMSGKWSVQARFVAEPGKFSIYFERFGAEFGDQNFDLPPGSGSVKNTVWTALLEISNGQAFWRFSDGEMLASAEVARRVLSRVRNFQREYATSVLAPGY
jgi:hypothetical protein